MLKVSMNWDLHVKQSEKIPGKQIRLGSVEIHTASFKTPEKAMSPHSSVLAWRISGTGEPGGLPSMGSQGVRHDWSGLAAAAFKILFLLSRPLHPLVITFTEHVIPEKYSHPERWEGGDPVLPLNLKFLLGIFRGYYCFSFFSQKMNFCHTIVKHSDENQNIWVFVLHLTTRCHSFGSELKPPYLTLFENSPGFVKSVCFCFFFLIYTFINKEVYLNKLQYMGVWLLGRC